MGLRPLQIFLPLRCGDRLKSSESDVYRRQILTSKVDPRAVELMMQPFSSQLILTAYTTDTSRQFWPVIG